MRSKTLSILFKILSYIIFPIYFLLGGYLLFALMKALPHNYNYIEGLSILLFLFGFVVIIGNGPAYFHRVCRQFGQPKVEKLLSDDKRPPILYLRSFMDDKYVRRTFLKTGNNFITEEEQMVMVLQSVGPVIAVGNPGSKFSNLGSAQFFFGEDQWKDKVIKLLN